MDTDEILMSVGRQLRKVPGASPLLDRRVRRMNLERQALMAAEEAGREEEAAAAAAAAWERDQARLRELGAKGGLRINVGCGLVPLSTWVNVDISPYTPDGVLMMNAAEAWPLPDGAAEAINSEHFIEHIGKEEALAYLKESARVLRTGGVIRTSTPSLRGEVDAYLAADPEILASYRDHPATEHVRTHAEMINMIFYNWGHRHIYDFESLEEMLEEAGFESIEAARFGHSRHPVLEGIDIHDSREQLRDLVIAVDAVKA